MHTCCRISSPCGDSVSSPDFLSRRDLYRLVFVSCQKRSYLHLRPTEQKQEEPAGPDAETQRNTSVSSVILIHQLFLFIYITPPHPQAAPTSTSLHAEKDHPLVVETAPAPPPVPFTATCFELFIHHYRQWRCEASLIPPALAGSFLPLRAVGCQIVSGHAGRF